MKPAVTFPDPQLAVVETLRALFPTTSVATRVPADRPSGSTDALILVRMDAGQGSQLPTFDATVRVAVWAPTEYAALALALEARARLLAHPGDSSIRVVRPLTGPVPTSDPESGDPLAFFTVAVSMRPQTL